MAVVTQIQLRRDTAANWTSTNPTLASGEMGFETNTGKAKIGDGSSTWTALSYAVTGTAGTVTSVVGGTGLTGGTITSTGTLAIDTSVVVDKTTTQTLTNKTLTSPVIGTIVNTGTLTLPTSTDTLVGRATTDTLTNKTLTSPVISTISNTGTLTLPTSSDTLVGRATTDTLTNKTLTAPIITYSINAQTASYTPVLSDAAAIVTMSVASANTFSIPTNASVAYAIGSQITVIQIGAGQTTIQAVTSGTTTIASTGGTSAAPKIRAQYAAATCIKVGTDLWYITGDIA